LLLVVIILCHTCCFKLCSSELANFDPLGINSDLSSGLNSTWKNLVCSITQTFESTSSAEKGKPNSSQGVAGIILLFIYLMEPEIMSFVSPSNRGLFN